MANTGKQVAKKTKEITDTVQLKSQIATEKETIERLYASIGKQVFEAGEEEDEKKFFTEFGSIRKSMDKKKELEEELTSLDGCRYCPECGARIEKSSLYCSRCGAKIDKSKMDTESIRKKLVKKISRRKRLDMEEQMRTQMEGTKEEEQEAQIIANEIESASADITIDIVNH